MATSIMNILGGKMIISDDKFGTVCWTGQYHHVGVFLNIGMHSKI